MATAKQRSHRAKFASLAKSGKGKIGKGKIGKIAAAPNFARAAANAKGGSQSPRCGKQAELRLGSGRTRPQVRWWS